MPLAWDSAENVFQYLNQANKSLKAYSVTSKVVISQRHELNFVELGKKVALTKRDAAECGSEAYL
jgi:hypothetical protein